MRLYLLPHQDDEFALLQSISNQGGEEYAVVFITNGRQPGVQSETRNAESLKVLGAIGTDPQQVFFLGQTQGFDDGYLHLHIHKAWNALLELTASFDNPISSIFMPAWEGGHQDHDIAHVLGVALATKHNCLQASRQISMYHGYKMPWKLYRVQSPLQDNGTAIPVDIPFLNRIKYLSLFRHYRSQWKTWVGLYPFVLLKMLLWGKEMLQPVSRKRIEESPHYGRLLYEKRLVCEQRIIRSTVAEFLSSLEQSSDFPASL